MTIKRRNYSNAINDLRELLSRTYSIPKQYQDLYPVFQLYTQYFYQILKTFERLEERGDKNGGNTYYP